MNGEPASRQPAPPVQARVVMPRIIVLTGFMGTGKSTIGRLLARQLRFDHLDTDQAIEAVHGSIHKIFEQRGEDAFRQLEREVVSGLAGLDRTVVSTGGGTLLDAVNLEALRQDASIFCLVATVDDILMRITRAASHTTRPLLTSGDPRSRIEELLAERAAGYSRFAQVVTTGMTPSEVAGLIAVKAAIAAQTLRAEPNNEL